MKQKKEIKILIDDGWLCASYNDNFCFMLCQFVALVQHVVNTKDTVSAFMENKVLDSL